MNKEELGLNTFIERDINGYFITLKHNGIKSLIKMRLETHPITY